MSPEPPLDATGIARRQFSTVRKGYDPTEVRAYLNELSEVMGRIQREEAHEHERAERAENRAQLAEQLDEHRLVELLGEETARVLEAAREAASGIRVKAEESAARMVREAQVEARATTEQAERDAAARRAEIVGDAEALRREAEDEVERRRIEGQILIDDMRRSAEVERDEMLADGERTRAEAEAAAEQIRAAARDQGRRLVGEAQAVRERILGDLARRRRTAREQLERLNGARERLLAAYEVVRRTVDEATTELTVALPEARLASANAVQRVRDEPDESVDVLEAELSVARMSGQVDVDAAAVSDDELDAMLRELAEEEAAQAAARREAEAGMALGETGPPPQVEDVVDIDADAATQGDDAETDADAATHGDDAGGPGGAPAPAGPPGAAAGPRPAAGPVGAPEAPAAPEPGAAAVDAAAPTADPPPPTEPVRAATPTAAVDATGRSQTDAERWGVRLPRSRAGGTRRAEAPAAAPPGGSVATVAAPASAGSAAPAGESGESGESGDTGETGPYVDELFARIRAERGDESDEAAGEAAAEPGAIAVMADAESAEAEEVDEVVDPATRALRARDEVLAPLERELGRHLKRILADEQNEVLDRLRRGGTVEFADVLPEVDEHADRYAIAAGPDLDAAAVHGAGSVGGGPAASCDPLAGEMSRSLVQPLRRRVQRSFDDADGDLEEVTERLRALYREWKGQRIGAAVRHYTAAAYSVGVAGALPAGEGQRWLVDPSCAACPDCDDNALAGDVGAGDAFPTGDTRAPAHPDCRCLVVVATALTTG